MLAMSCGCWHVAGMFGDEVAAMVMVLEFMARLEDAPCSVFTL